jgi:hypothetical protein
MGVKIGTGDVKAQRMCPHCIEVCTTHIFVLASYDITLSALHNKPKVPQVKQHLPLPVLETRSSHHIHTLATQLTLT